jgi:hypothetical protein
LAENIKRESDLEEFVLMERIKPVEHYNYIVQMFQKVERIAVHTELGIFGITLSGPNGADLLLNEYAGFTATSKDAKLNEGFYLEKYKIQVLIYNYRLNKKKGGIMAGFGEWDSIYFTD